MNELAILVTAAVVALVVALAYIYYAAVHDGPPAHKPDHFRLPLFPGDDDDNDWN